MSESKSVTEREAILREREAYARAVIANAQSHATMCRADKIAADLYPLPKVERPRVVKDPHETHSQHWRCVDGVIEFAVYAEGRFKPAFDGDGEKSRIEKGLCTWPTPARIELWADLLASPNELVEVDS